MRPWYRFCLALAASLIRTLMRPRVSGQENIPLTGGLIVAANHLSYWDPPLTSVELERETHFLAKEELFGIPLFGRLIRSLNAIPVRRKAADLRGISSALKVLKDGRSLILFPEGGRSVDGSIRRARPGIGLLWAHARVPILPVYLVGTNRFRRWIVGREQVRIRFGPVLRDADFLSGEEMQRSRAQYQHIADRVMDAIRRLKEESEAEEQGMHPAQPNGGQ